MKKLLRALVLFLSVGLFLCMAGVLLLALYYRNNFPVNTWINGVYCTGKTVEQVNAELILKEPMPAVTLVGEDGQSWQLDMQEVYGSADYTAALKIFLRKNATMFWMNYLKKSIVERIEPTSYTFDRDKLRESFDRLPPVQESERSMEGVSLVMTEEGYVLRDGNSTRLNADRAFSYLVDCLESGETYVNLKVGNCYETLEDSLWDRKQRVIWSLVKEFTDCHIVYDMGAEKIPLSSDITGAFLAVGDDGLPVQDRSGNFLLDESGIRAWVEELASAYDTVDTMLEFQSTRGDVVEVKYETYGTKLDVEAEVSYLMKALTERRQETENHIPAYIQEGFARGLNDIGGTYIEVDMTEQHMYYYMDGELVLDTDVVTGDIGRRRGTPEGVNFVYSKQRNRILRGPGYASPVKYWMPVRGNVGIHDSDWRSKYGGEIYKTDGSHGCVNTPPEIMVQLYEMVEIGTPVIMFY